MTKVKPKKDKNDIIKKKIAVDQENWLEAFKKKWTVAGACLVAGISRETYYKWIKDGSANLRTKVPRFQ